MDSPNSMYSAKLLQKCIQATSNTLRIESCCLWLRNWCQKGTLKMTSESSESLSPPRYPVSCISHSLYFVEKCHCWWRFTPLEESSTHHKPCWCRHHSANVPSCGLWALHLGHSVCFAMLPNLLPIRPLGWRSGSALAWSPQTNWKRGQGSDPEQEWYADICPVNHTPVLVMMPFCLVSLWESCCSWLPLIESWRHAFARCPARPICVWYKGHLSEWLLTIED